MSLTPQPDGSERLYLHMGYFETLADAERWLGLVRRHYPNAFATVVPSDPAPLKDEFLTDTQVLKILETRRVSAVPDAVDQRACDQIALLRPDDTGTRRALKEAVAQGAPVSFAVQLHWSAQPIDLSGVPSLGVFKPHTLYVTESHREGRSCYFLRLGFFADPISAKQVAVQVCSTFVSAAVVPVVEREVKRAREDGLRGSAIPIPGEQRVERRIDSNVTSGSWARSNPLSEAPRHVPTSADSLSESGVRHLRVEVQEQLSGRWRIVRLGAAPSDLVHADP
jgi:hypothetical protein